MCTQAFFFRAIAAFLLVHGASGCGPSPGPTTPKPRPSAAPIAPPPKQPGAEWPAARWTAYDSLEQGLSMPLPEDPAWQVQDTKNAWLYAVHAPSSTRVSVRWVATDGRANRQRCETRARDLGGLLDREGATIVEKRRVDLPSDFDTVLEVGLLPVTPGAPITGFAMAIGGWSKRCFVYVLTTTASGRGAEQAVADRLALFVERSFLRLRFESDLAPLVPREKPPL